MRSARIGFYVLAGLVAAYVIAGCICFMLTSAAYESVSARPVSGGKLEHETRLAGPSPRVWFLGADMRWPRLHAIMRPWARAWLVLQCGHFPPSRTVVIPDPTLEPGGPSATLTRWR